MRPLRLALTLVLLAVPASARAQHQVTAGLAITSPRGEFDRNTDTGFGFTGSYLYALHPSRAVALGVTGTVQGYGRTERRVPLSGTIPDITVDVETSNNTAFLQGLLQLKAPLGVVQPYVQGTAGFGWFFTQTALQDPLTDQTVLSDTNQSDGTWIWGGGGGVLIRVHESEPEPTLSAYQTVGGPGERRTRIYLDLGARYLAGEEVEYLREGPLVTDDGVFDIDARLARSEIEAVQYTIGATFEF